MKLRRGRHRRQMIHEMHRAESNIRASLSGGVKVFSQEEIDAIASNYKPPQRSRSDYRSGDYAE